MLVYGGAVMVMFLFVIAYLGEQDGRGALGGRARPGRWSAACLAGGAILVEVIVAIGLSTGGSLSHSATIDALVRLAGLDRRRSSSPTT